MNPGLLYHESSIGTITMDAQKQMPNNHRHRRNLGSPSVLLSLLLPESEPQTLCLWDKGGLAATCSVRSQGCWTLWNHYSHTSGNTWPKPTARCLHLSIIGSSFLRLSLEQTKMHLPFFSFQYHVSNLESGTRNLLWKSFHLTSRSLKESREDKGRITCIVHPSIHIQPGNLI